MGKKVSVVGIQVVPSSDPKVNLAKALALADEAFELYRYVDVMVLPEYFYRVPPRGEAQKTGPYPDVIIEEFSKRAKKHSAYIIPGTAANRRSDGKVYNTALLIDREGKVAADYSKIHLFDALNAMGGTNESDMVTRGDKLLVYDADFGRMGVVICYDIRFPELSRTLALRGVQYLFVPAAFYSPRFDHWQDLIRVTAMQNSMYVTGVTLAGKLNNANIFCGRSVIADPWGVPMATASDRPGIIQAYLDPDYMDSVRDAMGMYHNRAPGMYDQLNVPGAV